jgi:hypothetical protein
MSQQVYSVGLPNVRWGQRLKGKKLKLRLLYGLENQVEGEVIDVESDYENWHTCFLKLRKDDNEIVAISPFVIGEYMIIGEEAEQQIDGQQGLLEYFVHSRQNTAVLKGTVKDLIEAGRDE